MRRLALALLALALLALVLLALTPALIAPPAQAQSAPDPTAAAFALTYAMFEQGVAHVDLEVCPEPLASPDRFCRATLVGGMINVFAFAEAGEQPLVAFQSWDAALLNGLMD